MKGPVTAVVMTLIVVALLFLSFHLWKEDGTSGAPEAAQTSDGGKAETKHLFFYCAAGIKKPVAEIARRYEEEYGVVVEISYGGSGTLLSNLQVARYGDLYLAGDASYIDIARERGLVAESIPLAYMRPVVAFKKGNPLNIRSADDLTREDVRVALGNPSAASVGKWTKHLLEKRGIWDRVEKNAKVFKPTVNEVANDVKIGAVDAGVIWDATANQYDEIESVPLDASDESVKEITVGVLSYCRQPTAALHFARYLGARDRGLPVFKKYGFTPVAGDKWADVPEFLYFSGGVNRLAIQDTLREFEQREGVRITTVYNGCGILKGQIKLGERPDAYHTCDESFMDGVEDRFGNAVRLTRTDMVLLVPKGNPENIRNLDDLGRSGLKIGLANEKQSALGALTARLLRKLKLYDAVEKNVVARTPTADLLVNQLRTGSLDAVVVYRANTVAVGDKLDLVEIDHPMARAVQTFAVGKSTDYHQLIGRLFDKIHTDESRKRFDQGGFLWLDKTTSP